MLQSLFSDTELLNKKFNFNPGINVILGKYSDDKKRLGINGIGKSSLIRLINYCFLSQSAEKVFSNTKYDFLREENHNIILQFNIQNISYFIKRSFNKNDIVLFGKSLNTLQEYEKEELKRILTNKFFPFENNEVFFEGKRFGTLIEFFIKDDIENQKRIDPLAFSKGIRNEIQKAIFNFFLLNLPTQNLIQFEELTKEHKGFSQTIKGLEENVKINTGKSIEEFKSERINIEKNISLLERSLDNYNFLENYKNLESKLIEITGEINDKLKEYHSLNRKLKKVKDSFQFNQEIDIEQIKKLYNEALSTFGDLVKKTLDEIKEFKSDILENRNKFLITKEKQLQTDIDVILKEISSLEKNRSKLYKKLDEKGALESITNTYEQLIEEKTTLESNLQVLKQVDDIQEKLDNLNVTISEVKRDISIDLRNVEKNLYELRALFQEILKSSIFLDEDYSHAYFDISSKSKTNRDHIPFKIEVEIPKDDALGQSRLRLIAYDLMVFLHNIRTSRKLPDFIAHDGVFHGIANNTRVNTLNYIYHQFLSSPKFQYLVTFNEDEIYIPENKESVYGKYDFDWKSMIVAEFSDSPKEMIFKRAFT
jgi:uncharacterized protein YydD (DUF2326 family)